MDKEKHLKHLMEMKSGSVKAFSEDIGLAYTTVRSILERGVFNAKVENIIKICKGLNIKPENIMDLNDSVITESITTLIKLTPPRQQNVLNYAHGQLEEQNDEVNNIVHMTKLKRIHASAAGVVGEELFDDIYEEEVEFEADKVPKGADYCVLVNGDSMEPMIRDGSCAFIKKTDTVSDGTIALVIVDGAGYIKRVDIYDDVIRLVSLNPKYEDIIVQSHHDMKVFGKVVL
ncbi:peptidase S24 [Staphylococcus chromogenes]|uniref:helix-turn-helix domain-containing protein n=1 Tax=Staphylococcus chromogenes TaxID=46126 RepID=UPI000D022E1D|nr:XRE family transcriptional regulator [Staphylococcus chromogenes]MCE4960614.1 LexA family transcriptional regulator [Staphylococcus chromogenes]MEB7451651.1 XRE family transcriptional regulator [Staphylococcus chromogenes]PTF39305.1 peptidase S24 [Staphylococcus chromogenes]PTF51510.1 peptidase S24 [Staphylococcus chromogenes]PTF60888.1 peptidase S24 [Staphylococcus chromogenes]